MNICTPGSCPVLLQPAAGSHSTATVEQCGVKFFVQEHLAGSCLDGGSPPPILFITEDQFLYTTKGLFLLFATRSEASFTVGRGVQAWFGMSGSVCL